MSERVSTGLARLDQMLGGGLLPGTLTVVYGATGIGKTHLGVGFAHHGRAADGAPGILFDMNVRGDSQQHHAYAARLYDWPLKRWTHTVTPMADPYPPAEQMEAFYCDAFPWVGQAAGLPGADRRRARVRLELEGDVQPRLLHRAPVRLFPPGGGQSPHRRGRHRADGRAGRLHPALHLRRPVPEGHPPGRRDARHGDLPAGLEAPGVHRRPPLRSHPR